MFFSLLFKVTKFGHDLLMLYAVPSSALEVFRCLRLLRGFLCSVCGSTAGMARGGNGTVYGSMATQWLPFGELT